MWLWLFRNRWDVHSRHPEPPQSLAWTVWALRTSLMAPGHFSHVAAGAALRPVLHTSLRGFSLWDCETRIP